jgi:uncharacterized membrane protein YhaH (DUF805 family)
MGFAEAIQRGFKKSTDWKGRASRPAFWWFALFAFLVFLVAEIVFGLILKGWFGGLLMFVVWLALLLPSLSVAVRRMHDQDKSGWWLWLGLIPFVGGIILLVFYCLPGTPGPNQYGSASDAE